MTRHKWADLIIDWAEGVKVQSNRITNPDDEGWLDCEGTPLWHDNFLKFRRKPKEPEWYENIPGHGVLCWVSDIDESTRNVIDRIKDENKKGWKYATPLTNEEIERFKR